MTERSRAALRREFEAIAPDNWERIQRTLTARRIAADLLARLDRPPSSHTRLGWELRERVRETTLKEVA